MINQWLVLDDVIYSSQYTLAKMLCDFVLEYSSSINTKDDNFKNKYNNIYKASMEIVNTTEHAFDNTTLKNKILSRFDEHFIIIDEDMLDWVLDNLPDTFEIDSIVSGLGVLIGQTKVVYDPNNLVELLIIKTMGLSDKCNPNLIYTTEEMHSELELQQKRIKDKDSRDTIFTANKSIIEKYVNEFTIFAPKNFAHCRVEGVDALVECWVLEEINKPQEDNNENK